MSGASAEERVALDGNWKSGWGDTVEERDNGPPASKFKDLKDPAKSEGLKWGQK